MSLRLDPLLLAKMATMELRARYVVEGALTGRHKSRSQGHSMEFVGHRAYTPSDDWRRIDWKVFARTDRWVIREQEAETNLRAAVLLDVSNSMAYAGMGKIPKVRYASFFAAALSYLLVHQGESVGLCLFGGGLKDFIPARGGVAHLSYLLDVLDKIQPEGETDLMASFEQVGQHLPRRSLVLVLSDFLLEPEKILSAVRTLSSRRHEVAVLQILDRDEMELNIDGEFMLRDMESGESLQVNPAAVRDDYRRLMQGRLEHTRRMLSSQGIGHAVFETDMPLDLALTRFLQAQSGSPGPRLAAAVRQ